ncbi:MAG: ferredoxin [Candidatus Aenigmatarchaeota archaeon]|nr:ferredoxin [Candidatus Aenigmarchaeota archaeon]
MIKLVKVDKNKCIGCGACASVCPDGFEIKNGKSTVKNKKAKCIEEAISVCPVGAISK